MRHLVLGLFIILLTATAADAATQGKAPIRSRVGIAAVVNDEVITFSDITNRIMLYISGSPDKPPAEAMKKIEQQTLSRLIDEKLQVQEAKDLGITIGEDQVNEGFAEIARQNGMPADEFKKRLLGSGVKPETLLDQIRAEIAWSQVIRRKLRPQVNVSETEIDNELDSLARTSGKTEYRVAEIFLNVADPKDEARIREEATKMTAQITKGASFAQVAKQFSQSPGAATGGDIGWVQEGQLDAKLTTALSQMQPGQISPPIRTDKGYTILFLRDVRQNAVVGAQAAAQPAAPAPAPAPVQTTGGDSILHLKQIVIPLGKVDPQPIINAKIVRAQSLKSEITSCEAMEQKAKDFIFDGTGDLGKVALSKMSEGMKAAVAGLPVGTLSDPVRNTDSIAVLMVCGREDIGGTPVAAAQAPSPAPAAPSPAPALSKDDEKSREKIAGKIGQQRLTQLQERYLRDLRATAFIDKRL